MSSQNLGDPLPDFTLPVIGGGQQSLAGTLEGRRGAVVVFWSGVCSHCRRYDAYLNGFAVRHGDLTLVVVAARQDETVEGLRRTIAGRGLTFEVLHDAERRLAHGWLVEQTPRVFLVDGERRLRYRGALDNFTSPRDPEYLPYLEPAIDDFLAGREIARPETASFGCAVESVYYQLPKPLGS